VEYTIEYPNDPPVRKAASDAAPMLLHEQIKSLERKF
jgi:hypothetical protein